MRGGKRNGAGRKPSKYKRKSVGIRLHPKIVERLRREGNQSGLIESLLSKYFNIDLSEYV